MYSTAYVKQRLQRCLGWI